MTSSERTECPRFKRLITAHELHLLFSPSRDELEWAADDTDFDEHLLALLLMLKTYRLLGCPLALEAVPGVVVDCVRRAAAGGHAAGVPGGTAVKHHRGLVRKQADVTYDQAKAWGIVKQSIRKTTTAKFRPADLMITIALEQTVEAGLRAARDLDLRGDGLEEPHRGERPDPYEHPKPHQTLGR